MDELIQQLKDKAGLNEAQAISAIQIMKEFIHSKVPPMFSGFVDNFFAESNPPASTDSFLQ